MKYKVTQELHDRAVAEAAKHLGDGADASIRESHSLAANELANYKPPQHIRHARFAELPSSMQQVITGGERRIKEQSLSILKSQMITLYTMSGVTSATAEAIVSFATEGII